MKKVIKKVLLSLGIMAMTMQFVSAQGGYSYQAIVRNADGSFMSGREVPVRVSLSNNAVVYYQEKQTVTTGANGELFFVVGAGEPVLGKFESVPWSTMQISMKTEICINGNDYLKLSEDVIKPVPYSLYAASANHPTTIAASEGATDDEALFSVKDENGNLIFAVYPNLVKVYVDDSDSKAVKSGFVVSNRRATKDGETADLFTVGSNGTQVYVDEDTDKAVKSGFVVSNRRATKDGETDDLLVIDATGTQVYFDEADGSKAVKSGFVVSNRRATKGDSISEVLSINANGTQIYVDGDNSKAVKSGFVVSNRRATKDGEADDVFVVDATGTQVYFEDADSSKAVKSGFVVSNRRATKADEDLLAINANGTQVFVGGDDSKAVKSGFVVSNRRATKDGDDSDVFVVDESGTKVFIDDTDSGKAVKSGFAVSGRKATKDQNDYLLITADSTNFRFDASQKEKAFAIVNRASDDILFSFDDQTMNVQTSVTAAGNTEYVDTGEKYTLNINSVFLRDISCNLDLSSWEYYNIFESYNIVLTKDGSICKADTLKDIKALSEYGGGIVFYIYSRSHQYEDSVINFRFEEGNLEVCRPFKTEHDQSECNYWVSIYDANLKCKVESDVDSHNLPILDINYKASIVSKKGETDGDDALCNYLNDTLSGYYKPEAGSISCTYSVGDVNVNYYYDSKDSSEYFYFTGEDYHCFKVVKNDTAVYYQKYNDSYIYYPLPKRNSMFLSAKSMLDIISKNKSVYLGYDTYEKTLVAYYDYVADSAKNILALNFMDEKSVDYYCYSTDYSCLYDNTTGVISRYKIHGYKYDTYIDEPDETEFKDLDYNVPKSPDWMSFLNEIINNTPVQSVNEVWGNAKTVLDMNIMQ